MDVEGFERLRPKLEAIAYRMTGSVADAQDVAQDTWIRWSGAGRSGVGRSDVDPSDVDRSDVDRSDVEDAEAYLVRIATRLSLDRLRSAARRRETYVGPYLPEPVVGEVGGQPVAVASSPEGSIDSGSPEERALLADSLTYSFLVLLDQLAPIERAVLLLHDVFGYPFEQIAEAVDRSPSAVRQVASRTRRRIAEARPGWDPDGGTVAGGSGSSRGDVPPETLLRLVVAVGTGDVSELMDVLAPDVVTLSDGGPLQRAARRPVVGSDRVARLLVWLNNRALEMALVSRMVEVNGRPGMAMHHPDGRPYVVITGEVDPDGRVSRLFLQLNPDKLTAVPPA